DGVGASSGKARNIGRRPVCVIVDEIDGVTGGGGGAGQGGESGFINELVKLILDDQKHSRHATGATQTATGSSRRKKKSGDVFRFHRPVIAICNDLYAPALRQLRPLAEIVY